MEAFPLELNCFLLTGSIGSYLPGPGKSLAGKMFSALFSGSNSVLLTLLAAKLASGATCFEAF